MLIFIYIARLIVSVGLCLGPGTLEVLVTSLES